MIFLDGHNDFVSTIEYKRLNESYGLELEHSIINWASPSYHYFESMNNYRKKLVHVPVLTFTALFVQKLARKLTSFKEEEKKLELYENLPEYKLSGYLKKKFPYYENSILINLDSIAAYAALNNLSTLFYLQPHLLEKNASFIGKETEYFKMLSENDTSNPYDYFREAFFKSTIPTFERYKQVYFNLAEKYKKHSNIKFFDIVNLFANTTEQTFLDHVHYTTEGNKLLAERFYNDILILRTEKVPS